MPVGVSKRGTRRLALALLGLAWLAFVFPVFGGRVHFPTDFGYPYFKAPAHVATPSNPADTDSFHAVYPYHVYLGQQLRAGHLPLWDPTRFAGVPYAADISMGAFYPPNWLFAAGHVEVVGTFIWAASLLASLLLAYWFLRVLSLHPLASAAVAIVWTSRGAAVTAGAFLVAAGLASVQLLGTLEYSHLILRQKEAYATVVTNRVHAGFLATSLIPDYFGNPADHNFRYLAFAYTSDVFYA